MKKKFWLIALLSTVLMACSNPANQQATTVPQTNETESPSAGDRTEIDPSSMEVQAKASKDIQQISPDSSEVPMGDAEIIVRIEKENLTPEDIEVDVTMPMEGEEPMTSLAIVEAGDQAQEFKIKTNFGMVGPWAVQVKAKDAEPAIFAFEVK